MSNKNNLTFNSAYGEISIPFNKLVASSLHFTKEDVLVKLKTVGLKLSDRTDHLDDEKVIDLNFVVDFEAAENILKCMKQSCSRNA